jgi:trans-aconitate methyltransferase
MAANGSAAARYQRYVAPFVRPFAEALLNSLPMDRSQWTGGTIVDHGAGTGTLSKLLRVRGVNAPIVAVDPSADYLSELSGVAGVCTVVGTASALAHAGPQNTPLSGVSAVVSNMVLPFCPQPTEDLILLRSACRQGAVLRCTVLGVAADVEPFHMFWSAVHAVLPGAWEPGRYPHHKLAGPGTLLDTVTAAGWVDVDVVPVVGQRTVSLDTAWEWLSSVLPVGIDSAGEGESAQYRMLTRTERAVVRAEFYRRWGAPTVRTLTTTNALVLATAP